ncbi:MAG TPA: FAD-binding oxidoreductase, partial [Flavisolibacter sp.]
MKRDGATISLWQDTVGDVNLPTGQNGNRFDVLIVGGGITGITTALLLQKQGLQCVIAEAHTLCFGTTGGTTSHINTFFDTSYDQIESDFGADAAKLVSRAANRARDLFQQHVVEYNIDCGFEEK